MAMAPMVRRFRRIAFDIAETKYLELGPYTPTTIPNWVLQAAANPAGNAQNGFSHMSLLNMMAQGTANNQRIGNKVFIKYIQLFICLAPATGFTTGGTCRYLVLMDDMAAGTVPTLPGTYLNPAGQGPHLTDLTAANAGAQIWNPKNPDLFKRFKTLLDRQHNMNVYASGVGTPTPVIQHYIPINKVFQYKAGGAANLGTNDQLPETTLNFYLGADAKDCCRVSVYWRVAFKDS